VEIKSDGVPVYCAGGTGTAHVTCCYEGDAVSITSISGDSFTRMNREYIYTHFLPWRRTTR
jgi:hypothetical protein